MKKNYEDFLDFLDKIIKRIEKEFSFRYKLKFILQFKTNIIENHKFKIDCIYTAYIPNENPFEYEDKDILEKWMNNGFTYLLEKINNETYNDLKYVD